MPPINVHTDHSENKRLRKPTKRLLESAEEYEQIFIPKKKSKKRTSELSKMVRYIFLSFFMVQIWCKTKKVNFELFY